MSSVYPKGIEFGSPLFRNSYDCPCGEHWDDVWDCGSDDECGACGRTISPTESEDITPKAPRLSSHRLIDADGRFYCASDLKDCRRLLRSALNGKGTIEENQHPIWVNDPNNRAGLYTGPATAAFSSGHPITDGDWKLIARERELQA